MKTKLYLMCFITLSLFILIFILFFDKIFYKVNTEKAFIFSNNIFLVRRKVPIDVIQNYRDLFKFLKIDYIFFKPIDPTLEKFDLNSGELIEKKDSNKIFHSGYFEEGCLIDIKTNPNKIFVYSLLDMKKILQFDILEKDTVLFDSAKMMYYAKFKDKIYNLKNDNDIKYIWIPLEPYFDVCDIYNGLILLRVYKANEKNLKQYQIYDISKNLLKGLELKFDEWSLNGLKNLKLLAHKIGTGEYFIIVLEEKENSYYVKSLKSLHNSVGICDHSIWDKINNKIYFYNSGEVLFKDNFDIYQYDDNTFDQKIIHVKLKR